MEFSELGADGMITLSKLGVAEFLLERALLLFLEEKDYVCSITLAGAAEALGSFVKACVATGRVVYNENWSGNTFADMANFFRNGLKHYTDGAPITIPREAAVEILDRAVENFFALTGRQTPNMWRFMEEAHGL